ncbi:MAG: RDD family protein [Chlamydiia bacterium]|nr:RDD family protein [Chlamydiia bacterium]
MDKAVWYYMVGEEKEGPVSHNELQRMLDSGEVDSSTRVWTQSQQEWLPISEVEHFNMTTLDEAPTIEIEKKVSYSRETDKDYIRTRPWIRFWARMLDYSLFIIVLAFFIGYFHIGLGIFSSYTGMVAIFLWVFVEAFLLSTVGTTPGKWLLRVSVRSENHQKLSFSAALSRSFSVWWLGMGAGLPIISLITMIVAAVKLNSSGMTSWDRRGELRVFHNKVGLTRTLIVILYFLCYAWVVSWGQLQIMNHQAV